MSDKRVNLPLLCAIGAALALFVPAWLLIPRQSVFELCNGLIISAAVGCFVSFTPGVVEVIRETREDYRNRAADVLTIAIWLSAGALIIMFTDLWLFRVIGDPFYRDHWTGALSRWMLVIAALLCLAASRSPDRVIPPKAFYHAGVVSAVAVSFVIIIILLGY